MRISAEAIQANLDAIENFIDEYYEETGLSPEIAEIAEGTGISKSSVGRYLLKMTDEGRLEHNGKKGYATRNIACGPPIFADSAVKEYVKLPASLLGSGEFFLLTADGDSMKDADIDDGDTVVVRQQNYAEPGDIIVALIGDEATLKRYYPEPKKKRIRLQPENDDYEPIYVTECLIQGVAVTVWKNL